MIDLLSSRIVHTRLCRSSFTKLHTAVVHALDSKTKIIQRLKTNLTKSCHVTALTLSVRTPESNS